MPGGSYMRAYVLCPFYRFDDSSIKRIGCEGLEERSTIAQTWKDKAQFAEFLDDYCCAAYGQCPIYRLIMKEKYGEE